jgi:MoaA/NifB/PqqE/SkfB family radical SAM enzyme
VISVPIIKIFSTYFPRFSHNLGLIAKPVVLKKLAFAFFQHHVLKKPFIFLSDINITKKCNLHCRHCFATSFDKSTSEPSLIQIKKTIQALRDYGITYYNFQGGEVLLRKDLKEIIEYVNPRHNIVGIITNGLLLDKAKIYELKEMGVSVVHVSIDSFSEKDHDQIRNKDGVLSQIKNNIEIIRDCGMSISILTVCTRHNVYTQGFKDLIDFAVSHKIAVLFLVAQLVGNWRNRHDLLCTPKELKLLDEINRKHPFIRRDIHDTLGKKGCPAFKQSIYVSPSGEVLPCPFIHVSFGNLHQEPLKEIVRRGYKFKWFDHWHHCCPAAEEHEFIEDIQSKTFNSDNLPIHINEII